MFSINVIVPFIPPTQGTLKSLPVNAKNYKGSLLQKRDNLNYFEGLFVESVTKAMSK